ncbi:hypothetical protein DDT52_00665 [Brenneria roseae subsp. roseae]|nr:hypothetical protein DDT52_00665 [Brenneria roseae subsp. roseae]
MQDLEDKAKDQAFEDARKGLTDKEFKTIAYKIVFKEQNKKEEFSGRTYYEEIDFQEEQSIQNNIFYIHERYKVYKDYAYGVGLTIVVNERTLDQKAVERAIEDFYKRGEKEWINDNPVDKKELVELYNEVFKKTNCGSAAIKMD